jgi:hypothetical protein
LSPLKRRYRHRTTNVTSLANNLLAVFVPLDFFGVRLGILAVGAIDQYGGIGMVHGVYYCNGNRDRNSRSTNRPLIFLRFIRGE